MDERVPVPGRQIEPDGNREGTRDRRNVQTSKNVSCRTVQCAVAVEICSRTRTEQTVTAVSSTDSVCAMVTADEAIDFEHIGAQ